MVSLEKIPSLLEIRPLRPLTLGLIFLYSHAPCRAVPCPAVPCRALPSCRTHLEPQPEVRFLPNFQGKPKLIIYKDVGRIFLPPTLPSPFPPLLPPSGVYSLSLIDLMLILAWSPVKALSLFTKSSIRLAKLGQLTPQSAQMKHDTSVLKIIRLNFSQCAKVPSKMGSKLK